MMHNILKKYLNVNRNDCYRCFSLLLIICLGIVACSPSENHIEFSEPFELSAFLKGYVHRLPGQTIQFQILSVTEEPIPYSLLMFEWIEGGRMSFQTDQDGSLSMQFEKDILEYEVKVSPESMDAKLRVTW